MIPIDRRLWKTGLRKSYAPRWRCPSCAKGHLRLKRDTLRYEETAESRRSGDDDPWSVAFEFSALLECDQCREIISCCGDGGYEPVEAFDDDESSYMDHEHYFVPKYFSKPMEIFRPPSKCPNAVKEQIRKSFAVFFCDLGAAANHVRQCVEEILSHAGIQSDNASGGFIPLDTRIKSFEKADPENAERADALRWIGNFGSHPETLEKEDLFDAYDILEFLLEDLYVGHSRSVRQMVKQIIKERKPRSRL